MTIGDGAGRIHRHRFADELDTLLAISGRHPRLPTVHATYEGTRVFGAHTVQIVTDLCAGGTVVDYLGDRAALAEADVAATFAQVVSAVAFLHSQRPAIIHRDLKLDNIMVRRKAPAPPDVCLVDFGMACVVPAGGPALRAGRKTSR